MLHLAFCFSIWTLIFIYLLWRSLNIAKQAINHLKRLHQIPCSNCAYFTGDYRLKCTVNPMVAMSEEAIGCRDFIYDNKSACGSCMTMNQCSKSNKKEQHSLSKRKLIPLK